MTAIESKGWDCPGCGRTNYYRINSCKHCGKDRFGDDESSSASNGESSIEVRHWSAPEGAIAEYSSKRKRLVFLALACLSFFAWFSLMWEFRKWDANWGGLNVLLVAALAAVVMGRWLVKRSWFSDRTMPTGWRFMIIPAIGFIFCASVGILFTEPMRTAGSGRRAVRPGSSDTVNRRSPDYEYDYGQSRVGEFYLFSAIFDLAGGAADAEVDEECLPVLLILLVIALVVGSFFIPHFWVLATFLMTVAMAIFTFREWRLVVPETEM